MHTERMDKMKKLVLMTALQAAVMLAASFLMYLIKPIGILFGICAYGVYPLLSLAGACVLVRKGVNPYAAWFFPAACEAASGFLASMGYAPDFLPVLIAALAAMIGASMGDVMNKQDKRR